MIAYLSIGGSGTSDTLEQAALRAAGDRTPLTSAAIVEDARFGDRRRHDDVDARRGARLPAPNAAGCSQTPRRRRTRNVCDCRPREMRWTSSDSISASTYLIGGPTVPGTHDVGELITALEQKTGRPVELLS